MQLFIVFFITSMYKNTNTITDRQFLHFKKEFHPSRNYLRGELPPSHYIVNPSLTTPSTFTQLPLPFLFVCFPDIITAGEIEESQPILPKSVENLLAMIDSRDKEDDFSPIYKVPSRLRDFNPSSFTPRVVSIGPMHKGRENLYLMEKKKAFYLHELLLELDTSGEESVIKMNKERVLTQCNDTVSKSIDKIRRFYFGQFFKKKHDDEELTQMMVMDACFILQFLNKLSKSGDELHDNRLRSRSVSVDLVLLENQIPFFVLQDIYNLTLGTLGTKPNLTLMLYELLERVNPFEKLRLLEDGKSKDQKSKVVTKPSLTARLYEFLERVNPFKKLKLPEAKKPEVGEARIGINAVGESENEKHEADEPKDGKSREKTRHLGHYLLGCAKHILEKLKLLEAKKSKDEKFSVETPRYHILELLHEFYKPSFIVPTIEAIPTAHPAEVLHKVGVRFRPNKRMNWPLDMEYVKPSLKPTLKMPKVLIDDFFEVVMRNLIAYEQYSYKVKNYVSSYAMAMNMVVATPGDIAKLAESNVIVNNLGSNEKASNLISSICKDVTFPDFYYIETWAKAKKYYDSYWFKNFGVLKRLHFSTPWTTIALIAAVILFCIASIQFFYNTTTFASKHWGRKHHS